MLFLVKKPARSKNKKKKTKTTSTANQKAKPEHVAFEQTESLLDEKKAVDEKVKSDIKQDDFGHQSNSKAWSDLPDSNSLQFDRFRAEGNEDSASVAEESLVGGKGDVSLAVISCAIMHANNLAACFR